MTSKHIYVLLASAFFIVLIGIIAATYWDNSPTPPENSITTFEECIEAGNPAMESYPRQCRTARGQLFVEAVVATSTPEGIGAGCARAGCSNVVCIEEDAAPSVITTCIYKEEYVCYASARCEKQTNGKCGWTETPALLACLANPPSSGEPTTI